MEMTANLWSPSAGGGGDWRSAVLARAPQIATFVLALAVAAQLALIVVGLTGRTRQAPPPVAALPAAPPLDVGSLINAHLFGNAAAKALPSMSWADICGGLSHAWCRGKTVGNWSGRQGEVDRPSARTGRCGLEGTPGTVP